MNITAPLKLLLFAMSEHQSRYLYPNAEGKKKYADPHVFGCEKHQRPPQNEQ
jgi:hypothetical protein